MFFQRVTPALRQVTRSGYTTQTIGRRMQSTSTQATDPNRKAKLASAMSHWCDASINKAVCVQVFRFGPKDVPVELWPMAAVVFAGIFGGGFAISRHFYKDEDLRLARSASVAK